MANTVTVGLCTQEGCTRPLKSYPGKGLCDSCYKRTRYHQTKTEEVLAKRAARSKAAYEAKKATDPEAHAREVRSANIKKNYGITLEQYEAQYAAQEGRCLFCGDAYPTLNIDHCHETGKVRGLLCTLCNTGLGQFRDNVEALDRAAAYLRNGGGWL